MQNLTFRLGIIPVRVQPWFFATTALMNMSLLDHDPIRLPIWMVVVFASVLVHELGHALTVLAFGLKPAIELHGMGGTTVWAGTKRLSPFRTILISLAGPIMGLCFGALVFLGGSQVNVGSDVGQWTFYSLIYVNIFWGLLNLLPILPLDGGNVLQSALDSATHGRGARPAHGISLIVAVLALVPAYRFGYWWGGLLAILFASSNWQWLERDGRTSVGSR
ncbi:MAG: M50 family metallopeptidase [Polyangiaceae bacterium]|jgi:Zn-dependent protease